MKNYKTKQINFNEEMERDLEDIKHTMRKNFGLNPSNTDVLNLIMKTFKEQDIQMQRKPKSRRDIIVRL
jgi:flagellar basal body rod protein FlgB